MGKRLERLAPLCCSFVLALAPRVAQAGGYLIYEATGEGVGRASAISPFE